jgi:hypothetical protein
LIRAAFCRPFFLVVCSRASVFFDLHDTLWSPDKIVGILSFLAWSSAATILGVLVFAALAVLALLHRQSADRWAGTYLFEIQKRRRPSPGKPVHLLLCIADHYEPRFGRVSSEQANERVAQWSAKYPQLCRQFRDSDGLPPRHTFFFPLDEYVPSHVDALASLCRAGLGEVEIQLHHDHDTGESLRRRLLADTQMFRDRHGLLPEHKQTGRPMYGFVHGNWALDNSSPDGRLCGVNNELDILRETGCYADFTMPSAPSPTQTRKINSIYYAVDDPQKPKSHDWGIDAGTVAAPENALLLIQGPLLLNWRSRKAGLLPRVENGCIQGNQAPTMRRLDLWLRARIQIPSRPDWFFVKLHTHGAPEGNQAVLLGEPMIGFHRALAERAAQDLNFHYHYVTAREMYNLAKAAEAGWKGSVADARDFELVWKHL